MIPRTHLQVRLRTLPTDTVSADHFELVEQPVREPADGEVLVRVAYLSLDPVMRKRLADALEGRVQIAPGDLMTGRTAGVVVASRHPGLAPGDHVVGWGGWQQYAVEPGSALEKVDGGDLPLSVHLGVLGRPGITAWLGMVHVSNVQAGDRVVVSSAAGAVGSVAAQIARHRGADVVGIAGGPDKCAAVVRELGVRACVDYKAPDFAARLAAATPQGVDLCFENVGAAVLDATLDRMNVQGRIALCGLMGQYQAGAAYPYRHFGRLLDRALHLRGFRIDDHTALHGQARADLRPWLQAGALTPWENVTRGLAQAPAAFVAMLAGRAHGKYLVQLG